MNEEITCRVLTGPTASGKTGLGIQLALREGWEILCMDSMQIYRRMDIGTAKPTQEEMSGVPHHLLDICEPTESYSVSEYREAAERLVVEKYEQGKEILFVGGTVLYLQALMQPMSMGLVPANPQLRAELNTQAENQEGRIILYERLKKIDRITAERLHMNDTRRIIRAIEVWEATGIPFSEQPMRQEEDKMKFRWKVISTQMERNQLYDRINQRVSEMICRGLKEEVASLLSEGVSEDSQSMKGLGYKEMIPCIHGKCSIDEAADRIRTGTRHYAKRQMTFLRRLESIQYVMTGQKNTMDEIRKYLC